MRIERYNLDILFRRVPPEMLVTYIVKSFGTHPSASLNTGAYDVSVNSIPEKLFINLAWQYETGYSKDERMIQYQILNESLRGTFLEERSVFNPLYSFAKEVLKTEQYLPICKYQSLLSWQHITHLLGQDMFTTIFLAKNNCCLNTETEVFSWEPIITTDNHRLSQILNRGLAENHYHLNGSTQSFPINWVLLMNNPYAIDFLDSFGDDLEGNTSFGNAYNTVSWKTRLLWAVYIRQFLFRKTEHYSVESSNADFSEKETKTIEEQKIIDFLSETNFEYTFLESRNLKKTIDSLRYDFGYKASFDGVILDYALKKTMDPRNFNYYRILAGERSFLYSCFCQILRGEFTEFEANLFYLYLVIKSRWRGEFIQVNHDVGFKNFADYQSRKSFFYKQVKYSDYAKEAYRISLNGALHSQPIISLETRIMPQDNPVNLYHQINEIDAVYRSMEDYLHNNASNIQPDNWKQKDDRDYYYLIHYPKLKFCHHCRAVLYYSRNYEVRQRNKHYTNAIIQLLNSHQKMREAVLGIDACSNEIGCRPENFAQDFRCLRQVIPEKNKSVFYPIENPKQLSFTFHVGEDFLNMVDGLRAIDEAIMFLNMRTGDRIGHALALGVDAEQYYASKRCRIVMPLQDVLDDEIWLLYRSKELNISIEKELESQLITQISEHLQYIYGETAEQRSVVLDAFDYYCSWLLRGDAPELYKKGYFDDNRDKLLNRYEQFMVNDNLKNPSIRNNRRAAFLYYLYHFDEKVKQRGAKPTVVIIKENYIELVKQVQKRLQHEISQRGLMIECNPTSNLLIGTFQQYDKHPITVFNNMALEFDELKKKECAQISVSINTDDQGVFDTSLTNEYALMAAALERKTDEKGEKCYTASQVYQYIDSIRKMGLEQSFIY